MAQPPTSARRNRTSALALLAAFALLAALALILTGCSIRGRTPRNPIWSATGPDSAVQGFWQSVKAKDYATLERHISTNFAGQTPTARLDKTQLLARLRAMDLQTYTITDLQSRPEGADFVVTYTLMLDGSTGEYPTGKPLHMLSIWQQQKRGMSLIAQAEITPANASAAAPVAP